MQNKIASYIFTLLILIVGSACGKSESPNDTTATSSGNTFGVSSSTGSTSGGGTSTNGTTTTVSTDPATVTVSASPTSITSMGSSTITVTVVTDTSANVPDGTLVTLALNNATLGTVTTQATTVSGSATATFTAGSTAGTVIITAKAGTISNSVSLTIIAAETGSIEFTSASPQVLGIRGSGQTETATIIFSVKDINGNPASDVSVSFTMSGPSGAKLPTNGGEYIGDFDITPTTATGSTTSDGKASVNLNSGTIAGPITIEASATTGGGATISSSSAVISIGGGVPTSTHFNITTSVLNLPGLIYSGREATISAFIGDRFGNYNVLAGTSVSFYSEAGAIDRSGITDKTGQTSVTHRTQNPDPAEVIITAAEIANIGQLNTLYNTTGTLGTAIPTDGTVHPRDGWVTILATVKGEEGFEDENANGLYDSGENFSDIGEPFIDKDDDGTRDDNTPFELYIDVNGDGQYNGTNGVWDGPGCTGLNCLTSKTIWAELTLAYTGNAFYCDFTPSAANFNVASTVPDGGSQNISFMVGDVNTNALVPGTVVTITLSGAGTLTGETSYTVPDHVPFGPTQVSFNLGDSTVADPPKDDPKPATIIATVTGANGVVGCVRSLSGITVN